VAGTVGYDGGHRRAEKMSRGHAARLARGLFAVDSFGGGFVVQAFLV
jgi:hypothetical protein